MEFAALLALAAEKIAEEFGKAVGRELGSRLGKAIADALFGSQMDQREAFEILLNSISGIIQQALDRDDIRDAQQLIFSGNLQLKQLVLSEDINVAYDANKTYADAFGILAAHEGFAASVKAICALGHIAVVSTLASKQDNWKEPAAATVSAYIDSLKADIKFIEAYELETLDGPYIENRMGTCRRIKGADINECSFYWYSRWSINSQKFGLIQRVKSVSASEVGEQDNRTRINGLINQDLTAIAERKQARESQVLAPIRKVIEQLEAYLPKLKA